jgi:hypothetical protein
LETLTFLIEQSSYAFKKSQDLAKNTFFLWADAPICVADDG